ncbi:hypothetical protein WN48_05944 [Eufriesea mexicana]|nr:hypothetical protein WN48_05944 [Eufriesea mexicana]
MLGDQIRICTIRGAQLASRSIVAIGIREEKEDTIAMKRKSMRILRNAENGSCGTRPARSLKHRVEGCDSLRHRTGIPIDCSGCEACLRTVHVQVCTAEMPARGPCMGLIVETNAGGVAKTWSRRLTKAGFRKSWSKEDELGAFAGSLINGGNLETRNWFYESFCGVRSDGIINFQLERVERVKKVVLMNAEYKDSGTKESMDLNPENNTRESPRCIQFRIQGLLSLGTPESKLCWTMVSKSQ